MAVVHPQADANPPSQSLQDALAAYNKLSEDDKYQFIHVHPKMLNKELQDALTTIANAARLPSGGQPSQAVIDFAWRSIIGVFASVFLLAALAIIAAVLAPLVVPTSSSAAGTLKTDILVTVFSTTVGFLAGVLTPSPVGNKSQ
jgi:hypothetical protein